MFFRTLPTVRLRRPVLFGITGRRNILELNDEGHPAEATASFTEIIKKNKLTIEMRKTSTRAASKINTSQEVMTSSGKLRGL